MDMLWEKWQADIPSLDRETWEECFEDNSKLVISSRDKLLQTKFMHRIYYTPQRLHKIYPHRSQSCPRCQSPDSTYIHMFGACPRLVQYWVAVVEWVVNPDGSWTGLIRHSGRWSETSVHRDTDLFLIVLCKRNMGYMGLNTLIEDAHRSMIECGNHGLTKLDSSTGL